MDAATLKPGQTIFYDDGRLGHRDVSATVLAVTQTTILVQFEDRADTTTIHFSERAWMDYLKVRI